MKISIKTTNQQITKILIKPDTMMTNNNKKTITKNRCIMFII